MIARKLSKNVTEYKLENYDELVKEFKWFITFSQFEPPPPDRIVTPTDLRIIFEPKCSAGRVLYGIDTFGRPVKLMSIIDSSD